MTKERIFELALDGINHHLDQTEKRIIKDLQDGRSVVVTRAEYVMYQSERRELQAIIKEEILSLIHI